MTLSALLDRLRSAPLVASAQASEGSPLANLDTLLQLAQSSLNEGVRVLRLQGVEAIRHIHGVTGAPTIGLIKRHYEDSPVYITPTHAEVDAMLSTPCEAIGLDATLRPRPGGAKLPEMLAKVKRGGRLAMADCDTLESALEAERLGFDFVGTTLAGYTENRTPSVGPDLELLREMVEHLSVPVVAEGRYSEAWQVQAALRIGAVAVVMGAALNDTPTLTKRYAAAARLSEDPVAAFDIGGTWLRFGLFSPNWGLLESDRIPLPADTEARMDWIRSQISRTGPCRVGVGSGGVIDPKSGVVTQAKPIIPNHVGTEFSKATLGADTVALNDGLATAWGHACLPAFAGRRVATLALGTGVGFGIVDRGRIGMARDGQPPHLNDMTFRDGRTLEEVLGGAALPKGDAAAREDANHVARRLHQIVSSLFHPDDMVVCGGVGLSDWLELDLPKSPFGADAGLYGAAALALFPPMP